MHISPPVHSQPPPGIDSKTLSLRFTALSGLPRLLHGSTPQNPVNASFNPFLKAFIYPCYTVSIPHGEC